MPILPEWYMHECTVIALCSGIGLYPDGMLHEIQIAQNHIIKTISQYEPVIVLKKEGYNGVFDDDIRNRNNIRIIDVDSYDIWVRDTLPSIVRVNNVIIAIDWNFNVWGETFSEHENNLYYPDRFLARELCRILDIKIVEANIVAEGGAIETNGDGIIMTTESCLLTRNSEFSKEDIERELVHSIGAKQILWMPGSDDPLDAITNGHIDGIARFVSQNTIVCSDIKRKDDPRYENIKLVNAHYSEINNELARDCNVKAERIRVYTTDDAQCNNLTQ